jgi:hypothetical protein
MKPLTLPHLKSWLETYGQASAENDPQASANLFAQDCLFVVGFNDSGLVSNLSRMVAYSRMSSCMMDVH